MCMWGNPYYCGTDTKVCVGTVATTVSDEKTIKYEVGLNTEAGEQPEAGKHYPWIAEDFYNLPNLMDGMTLTVFGSQEGTVPNNWSTLLWEMKDGWTGRLDNYGWSFGSALFGGAAVEQNNKIEPAVDGDTDAFWAKFCEIARKCEWTLTFKLNGKILTVEAVLTGADAVYTQYYKFNVSSVPEAGLGVHLTGENVTITYKGYTVE